MAVIKKMQVSRSVWYDWILRFREPTTSLPIDRHCAKSTIYDDLSSPLDGFQRIQSGRLHDEADQIKKFLGRCNIALSLFAARWIKSLASFTSRDWNHFHLQSVNMRQSTFTATLFGIGVLAHPASIEVKGDSRFQLYDLPTKFDGPCDLEHGPDGALWGQGILNNVFFRLDPATGKVVEYPIPFTTPLGDKPIQLPGIPKSLTDRTAFSCAIRRGADGNLYAGNGVRNQLLRINPTTKKIDIFQIPPSNPAGDLFFFNDLYTAKDGIWVTSTTANQFSYFPFATEKFEPHFVPTPAALPLGLLVASDGVIYVAEFAANKILTYDPKTKITKEYVLPEVQQFPTVIRAERDGWVYFALFIGNGIGRINMKTKKIELFHTNKVGLTGAEDTIDKHGGVWLSSLTRNQLSRLDTNTLKYSYVKFPTSVTHFKLPGILGEIPPVVDIAINYGPGDNIWFTSILSNQVGRYNITGLYK